MAMGRFDFGTFKKDFERYLDLPERPELPERQHRHTGKTKE